MRLVKYIALAGTAAVGAISLGGTAPASLVYDSTLQFSAQGFGAAPRLLTVQETGLGDNVESGCVAPSGGAVSGGSGACVSDASVHDGNGFTNTGGDEVNPLSDNQKFGVPTISEMGWNDASDIGLLFNPVEPSGDSITVNDVTLKFYNGDSFLAAIDGSQVFGSSDPGNGVAGFTFIVDAAQQAYLDTAVFGQAGFGDFRIALESTMSDAAGGPESWLAFNRATSVPIPEPATWAMMLLGFGAVGHVMRRTRRRSTAMLQLA